MGAERTLMDEWKKDLKASEMAHLLDTISSLRSHVETPSVTPSVIGSEPVTGAPTPSVTVPGSDVPGSDGSEPTASGGTLSPTATPPKKQVFWRL